MKIELEIPDVVEPVPASIVGGAFQEFIAICQRQNMTLEVIAHFLDLAARSLRTQNLSPDPLTATVQEAAKIAVICQSGLAERIFFADEDEGDEPDEIQALIDGLPDMPILEQLEQLDESFNFYEGNTGPIEAKAIQEAIRLVEEGIDTFIATWQTTGKRYALDEEKWREQASPTEIENIANYLFFDELPYFSLDNVAFAIGRAIEDAAIQDERELVQSIASILETSQYAFFVFRGEDLPKSIRLARRAISVRDKFARELESGLAQGGVKLSQFIDGYAEIRDIAETWVSHLISRGEVEVVKKGNRKTLVRPIEE